MLKKLLLLAILCLSQGAFGMEDENQEGWGATVRLMSELAEATFIQRDLHTHGDINYRSTPEADTLLMRAVKIKMIGLVSMLLEMGADPALHTQGLTPLMVAVQNADLEMCEILLSTVTKEDVASFREGILAVNRMRLAPDKKFWKVEQSQKPVIQTKPDEMKTVRKLILQQFINSYMNRAIVLVNQVDQNGRTARDIALELNYGAIAAILNLNNPNMRIRLEKMIAKNIMREFKKV